MTYRLASLLLSATALLAACGDGTSTDTAVASAGAVATAGQEALEASSGLVLATESDPDAGAPPAPEAEKVVLPIGASFAATALTDRYVIRLRDDVLDPFFEAAAIAGFGGGTLHHTYTAAIRGFSATLPVAVAELLRTNPLVVSIEPDVTMSLMQTVQSPATWGLDRVDARALPLNNTYRYGPTGTGVTAFVIDTGIRATHAEFMTATGSTVSRVDPTLGYTAFTDANGTGDCNGHGTHVAGTIGGLTYGVAKQVRLVPIRVLDCAGSGTLSGVIAGVDHVARSTVRPAVANMSLGGGASAALDSAVQGAVNAGVTVVVAAGNNNANACNYSPARVGPAITVGATTNTDARASFSNFGTCVDMFAPGNAITSAGHLSDTATATFNGTSMASPHVAGAAALLLEAGNLAPADVATRLISASTANAVTSVGTGSPNLLLFTNPANEPPPAVTPVWVSALTGTGARTTLSWTATATIEVRGASGVVQGARVAGSFSVGGTSVACTTAANGRCSIRSNAISTRTTSTRFSVTGITGPNLQYQSASNVLSAVTINRP